jgi:hypothetical protein
MRDKTSQKQIRNYSRLVTQRAEGKKQPCFEDGLGMAYSVGSAGKQLRPRSVFQFPLGEP